MIVLQCNKAERVRMTKEDIKRHAKMLLFSPDQLNEEMMKSEDDLVRIKKHSAAGALL